MGLLGIICLLSFYGCLNATSMSPEVTFEPSTSIRRIRGTTWNWLNNTKSNSNILSTPEMIKKEGYPAESYVIMTEDGYLLTLHRIPGGNDSLPVLLQHGLLGSSADWLVLGKDKALPYLLADQGYDVWLGNFRGNIYSRKHISLSTSDLKFWDFSFHEMGIYDIPAMITFITNMRSELLHTYIGHSMGATSFYITASKRPEIAQMVRMMINLAPAVYTNHMQSPIRYLVSYKKELQRVMGFFFHGKFLPDNFLRSIIRNNCDQNKNFCNNVISMIFGTDREQFNHTLLPVIFSHFPAGASIKTTAHFAQIIESGKFCQYDYGRAKNLVIYNSVEPPEYDLANITIPVALFYSDDDKLISSMDLKRLSHVLPNVMDLYQISEPKFNHQDFLWANDAPQLVYKKILQIMRKENPNNITSTK